MNLLAVSNEISALLVSGTAFIASVSLAYWVYLKGAAGQQSENEESTVVLHMDADSSQKTQSKRAA